MTNLLIGALVALLAASTAPADERAVEQAEQRTVADVYRPGETAVWVFGLDGARLGWHASQYVGTRPAQHPWPAGERFRGWLELTFPHGKLRSDAELCVDPAGRPLRFVQDVAIGNAQTRLELDFGAEEAVIHVIQSGSTRRMVAATEPAARLLANNFVSHLEIVFRLADGPRLDSPLFSASALRLIPFSAERVPSSEDDPPGRTIWTDSLGERLVFDDGRLERIEIPAQEIAIERRAELFEPFSLGAPPQLVMGGDFDVEEVRLVQGTTELAGFVTSPKDSSGRLPAVFFLSGSGAQDRHGFAGGIDVGTHEVLDAVTNAGFLVLRIDDRGAGSSSPMPEEPTLAEALADAKRCVDYLAAREDVDADRVFLIGHSEGAILAPLVAREVPSVAGVVLMAAPGRPMHEVILDQNRDLLASMGLTPEALDARVASLRASFERLVSDEELSDADRAALADAVPARRWLQDMAKLDMPELVAATRAPVLLVHGALDMQVSVQRDLRPLEAALARVEHPDATVRVFERLDHLFKPVAGERSTFDEYLTDRRVDAEFLGVLTDWLRARARID